MELEHRYGANVHVLDEPWSRTALARLCTRECEGAVFHDLLAACCRRLFVAACAELPTIDARVATRMAASEPRAVVHGAMLDPAHRVIVVDVARGGMVPSYLMQRELLGLYAPSAVRVDHLFMQRIAAPGGHVSGVSTSGTKLGGPVDGATVMVPDPMGATGRSIASVLELYAGGLGGSKPRRMVALHLIVTPEYLRRITTGFPDVAVYALRVDRGLSPPDVLAAVPGSRWDEERGLDDHDYIIPGAGGLGELINNDAT